MSQFGLPFDWPADAAKSDFLVSSSNRHVADHIEHWARWPVCASLLVGPRKSGKSLLGRVFAANTTGAVLDDAHSVSESSIFHAWNVAQETRKPLLIIANALPEEWPVKLPDLKSRLGATPLIEIGAPDVDLCAQLIRMLMERRGVALMPDVADFIAMRMERDYIMLQRIVDLLDQQSLSERRRISSAFARDTLARAGLIS